MEISIGIIGTGGVARAHMKALAQLPGARVAAVAGSTAEKARALAGPGGAAAYGDYREMLRREKLDAAFILLPPDARGEVERECAAHVGAVFIEKPVGNDLGAACGTAEFFRHAGTLVSVGYMMRYHPGIARARALFASERPVLVEGRWVGGMPAPAWWRDKARSGGQFVEQCTHLVDAARFVAGEIARVSAFGARGFVNDEAGFSGEDALTVNVLFESGAVGHFCTGCFVRAGEPAGVGLSFSARDCRAAFRGWGMAGEIEGAGGAERFPDGGDAYFAREDAAFLEAVRTGSPAPVLSGYDDAVRTLAVTLAAGESMRRGGRPVCL